MPRLAEEIRQTRPFLAPEEEATLNIVRTADLLTQRAMELLKSYELTAPQYNVLRILRGAGPDGLACGAIAERMVSHDPDVTRLLNRMEARGLISRQRPGTDRRMVVASITAQGLDMVNQIDTPMAALHRRLFRHFGEKKLRRVIELMELARKD